MAPLIYIPTYRRLDRQLTLGFLRHRDDVVIVAPPDEAEVLSDRGLSTVACPVEGIAPKRQWILDQHEGDALIMMDDDLRFAVRRFDEPKKFRPASPEDMDVMISRLLTMLEQVPMAGLAGRGGANWKSDPVLNNARINAVHCLRKSVAVRHGIRYDRLPLMEDFDVTLRFMELGYPVATLATHCWDNATTNGAGGCSTYRDETLQAQVATDLCIYHEGFVSIVKKPGWNGMSGERTDVRVSWRKAAEAGLANRVMLGIPQELDPDWRSLAPEWDLL